MNRRGVGELVDWFWPMFMMFVAIIVIFTIVRSYEGKTVDASDVLIEAYVARVANDPAIFVYRDAFTGRAYPGVFDAKKLTPDRLDTIFSGRTDAGFSPTSSKVEILDDGSCSLAVKEFYNDEKTFNEKLPFAKRLVKGPGSATARTVEWPITIVSDSGRCSATLRMTVVQVNA